MVREVTWPHHGYYSCHGTYIYDSLGALTALVFQPAAFIIFLDFPIHFRILWNLFGIGIPCVGALFLGCLFELKLYEVGANLV